MSVVMLDGTTVKSFVNDESFNQTVDESFAALDTDKDGVLSRSEMRRAFESLHLLESHFGADVATAPEDLTKLYDSLFDRFDGDRNGTVDLEEFRAETKEILLAIADGIGNSPIQMVLHEGDSFSFLKKAADLEAAKLDPQAQAQAQAQA